MATGLSRAVAVGPSGVWQWRASGVASVGRAVGREAGRAWVWVWG